MHHSNFVAILAHIYRPNTYLELGLYEGETWQKVKPYCKQMVGVDIVDRNIEGGKIFIQNTDTFFEHFKEKVDMVFIDADHRLESVLKDFQNSLNLLNEGGCIILHDTDPESDFLFDPGYCGDSYKIVDILERSEDLNITTFPISEAGLSIITKKKDTRTSRRLT